MGPDSINQLIHGFLTDPDPLIAQLVANDTAFLKELVSLRKQRMTQEQIAERLGVSAATVQRFESPGANPSLGLIRRYAAAIGVLIEHKVTVV